MKAVLSCLAYELGGPRRLDQLDELVGQDELAEALGSARAGLAYYLESELSPLELARPAAERTLDQAEIEPREIDAVIFATDSLRNTPEQYAELGRLLADLGLVSAYPLNVTLSDCANLQIALRVAASMIEAGELARVLVVSVDLTRLASPSRLIGDGVAVSSDAAASALLTADGEGFRIEAVAQKTESTLLDPVGSDHARLTSRVHAHRALFADLLSRQELRARDVRQVFANNFAKNVTQLFLQDNGFDDAQMYLANVRRLSHCFGSDCLVNLIDYQAGHEIAEGERFVLLGSGMSQLGAVLLRATNDLDSGEVLGAL